MGWTEQACFFGCGGQQMLGVTTLPEAAAGLGVVIVVGGPQYRAGSHRQFVLLARRIAADGIAVLRFDARGMGDSEGDQRSFDALGADIGAAIDALTAQAPTLHRVVLWGLCDGASAALMFVDEQRADRRVAGLCLLNPWVRSEHSLAQMHVKHYYLQRLREREFWAKLLRGGVAWQALRGLGASLAAAFGGRPAGMPASATDAALPFQQRMARGWATFDGPILLLLSGNDYTAKEFAEAWKSDPIWRPAQRRQGVQRCEIAGADHTLSASAHRVEVETRCLAWLQSLQAGPGARPPARHGAGTPAEPMTAAG